MYLADWLICCCVEGLFETGGVAKKSATSGVEGGLGSGEKCMSGKRKEEVVMLGDGVDQGGNKRTLAEVGGKPLGTLDHAGVVKDPPVQIGGSTLGGLGNGALVEPGGDKFVILPAEV